MNDKSVQAAEGLYSVACHAAYNYILLYTDDKTVWGRIKAFLDYEALRDEKEEVE